MAANTMDAIKKKMQAMKGDKDGARDKAIQLEQRVAEQKAVNEKVLYNKLCIILSFIIICRFSENQFIHLQVDIFHFNSLINLTFCYI